MRFPNLCDVIKSILVLERTACLWPCYNIRQAISYLADGMRDEPNAAWEVLSKNHLQRTFVEFPE